MFSGMFSFYSQKSGYEASNIVDFINNAVLVSRSGYCLYYLRPRSPGQIATPVRLLVPVNRRPVSLLELSRTVVKRHVISQHETVIDQLPVPSELRDFLKQTENI
jgi:SOCS box